MLAPHLIPFRLIPVLFASFSYRVPDQLGGVLQGGLHCVEIFIKVSKKPIRLGALAAGKVKINCHELQAQ